MSDEALSFASDIKPLFRDKDQEKMKFMFDLWSYEDVKRNAGDILNVLRSGDMPCDGPWPEDRIALFESWTGAGANP